MTETLTSPLKSKFTSFEVYLTSNFLVKRSASLSVFSIVTPATAIIWSQLVKNVKPKQEIQHMRTNILLHRLSNKNAGYEVCCVRFNIVETVSDRVLCCRLYQSTLSRKLRCTIRNVPWKKNLP